MIPAEAHYAVEDGQGIAQGSFGFLGDDVQGFGFGLNALVGGDARLAQAPEDSEAVPFSLAEAEPDAYFTAYHYDKDTAKYAAFTGKLDGNTFQFRRRDRGFWVRESGA